MKIELQDIDTSDLIRRLPGKKPSMRTAEPDWNEVYEAARERQVDSLAADGWSDCKMFSEAEERLDALYWHRKRMSRINAQQGEK